MIRAPHVRAQFPIKSVPGFVDGPQRIHQSFQLLRPIPLKTKSNSSAVQSAAHWSECVPYTQIPSESPIPTDRNGEGLCPTK
jgi:hypothetical protein